jgi:hypothetical protein
MKRPSLFFVLTATLILFPIRGFGEKAPSKIAGFQLGENVATVAKMFYMETALPVRDMRYITEVEIRDLDGYKSGTIAFGNCANPKRILRIKLKYAYSDKKFYRELLNRFEQRFGEPDEYRGDPFQVIIAWKWFLENEQNDRITMILQHSKDKDYKFGNTIKLTNTTLLEKERICYEKKHPGELESEKNKLSAKKRRLKDKDYQRFIPE